MYSGQGGFGMGNVAEAAAYYAKFRETSLSSIWESICEAIYKSFHPRGTSSLTMLCPSFMSFYRAFTSSSHPAVPVSSL